MVLSRKTWAFSFVILFFFLVSSVIAETKTNAQKSEGMSKPRLEGLREFHEVLHLVWHDAYPNKDYKTIKEAVPEFKQRMETIQKAELPGFFRERKEEFEDKREALAQAVVDLEKTAKGDNNKALLESTENLHTAYAQLAWVFAPRIKELENFHLVLYPLWHEALPNKDFEAIRASAPALQEKMDALMKVELSKGFKDMESKFIKKRKALKTSVDELIKTCQKRDNKKIEDKLDKMHTAYMELDGVFDED